MKSRIIFAVLASLSLNAQSETLLHPIVTASRIAQTMDQTMASVSVITREDIERSQSQSIPELIRNTVVGLDFSSAGGTGQVSSTFVRGTNSNHVLVLVDGMIVGSATTGTAALELIPVQQVERIEIVRGPRSSLYGSEAIGGVIQVFTKTGAGHDVTAKLMAGSRATREGQAAVRFGDDSSWLNISASHYKTDGFDVLQDAEPDRDGHENNSASLNLRHQLSHALALTLNTLHSEGQTEYDNNSSNNHSDFIQQNLKLGMVYDVNTDWQTTLSVGRSKDSLETVSFFNSLYETRREQLRLENAVQYGDTGQLSFGFDYLNDRVNSTDTFTETERDNRAVFVLVQDKFGNHQLQLSARADDNQAFGRHYTKNIAWSYELSGSRSISASWGTAFKSPTFNDLYVYVPPFPPFPAYTGNPDLKPETSRSLELGYSSHQAWGEWRTSVFETRISDLIRNNSSFTSTENAASATIRGIEFELGRELLGWNTSANLALTDPVDDATGNTLQNRAEQTLKLNLSNSFRGHQVTLNLLAQGRRYTDAANTSELGGYGIVNLMVSHPIDKQWTLQTKLENIFNKEYSTSSYFGIPANSTPISLYIGLQYAQ